MHGLDLIGREDAGVALAERVLGMPLPGPLRDLYLRVGNGDAESFLGLAGGLARNRPGSLGSP